MATRKRMSEDNLSSPSHKNNKKKEKKFHVKLNTHYMDKTTRAFSNLRNTWRGREELPNTDLVKFIFNPFPCCVLSEFVSEEGNGCGYLEGLKESLMKLKCYDKNNDLYQFKQSDDLKKSKSMYIKRFRELLLEDTLPWLRELTGIELTDNVDATCSKYEYTDTLLCHDDELEGRRVAFIYYLVDPTWNSTDGGTLDLFSTDEYGRPSDIADSVVPMWNSFVFFEVTPVSFHQVSEILTATKTRLSINGWFHGPSLSRPTPYKESVPPAALPIDLPLDILSQWVNPMYLDIGIQAEIRGQFENESQIELPDFLLTEKYDMLCDSLKGTKWMKEHVPNKRCVNVIKDVLINSLQSDSLNLLLSDPFCLLLSHLTGLQLSCQPLRLDSIPSENETESPTTGDCGNIKPCSCYGNWYRWGPGDYTLMSDSESEDGFVLEGKLYFECNDCSVDTGGYTTYIVKDEDDELLTVIPRSNSLSLVYRDNDTLSFTKYINRRMDSFYYSIQTVYIESSSNSNE